MPGTFTSLHYHVVFSTKNRVPLISQAWRSRLHEYLGGMVRGLDGVPMGVGGVADHVHLLFGLKPTHCLSDFMRDLKKDATNWAREVLHERDFVWQEGYAAFTVSPTSLDSVRAYISKQEEHHRMKTFREELIFLLRRSGIAFEDRFLD